MCPAYGRKGQLMKKDCILINIERMECRGLKELYCNKENRPCPFYKSERLYNKDGSKRRRR